MFKTKKQLNEHVWGKTIPMVPAVKQCSKCGNYKQVGPGYRINLPDKINLKLTDTLDGGSTYCSAEPLYTQYEYDEAVNSVGHHQWLLGQNSGLHLQLDFTQKFFNKIRLNPDTYVYEIPVETYQILKDMISKETE